MSDHRYVLMVLSLGTIPRLLTFALTLISLPLMLRALGADEYGMIVYLQSVTGLLELFASLGVSSAAGKGIATCRAVRPHCLPYEVSQWASLQGIVALISVLPVFGMGYLFFSYNGLQEIRPVIFFAVASTLYAAISATFVRMVLQSLLAFKTLAGFDTIDSIVRSAGWLVVAWMFPTALGLAVAGLITSCVAGLVGISFLILVVRRHVASTPRALSNGHAPSQLPLNHMLKESVSFMGLVLATRAYHTLPNILVGRLVGFEVAGILGAFLKIVEVFALPFTIVGNALMVRAQEVQNRGIEIVNRYWDMLCRFVIVAAVAVGAFSFIIQDVATVLLPSNPSAAHLFSLMTPLLFVKAASDLFAPASDYVGGLRSRVIFLFLCALLQVPLIWAAILVHAEVGAIVAIVGSQAIMVIGYVLIARRVFFGVRIYKPPKDVWVALVMILVSFGLASSLASDGQIGVMIYLVMSAVGFLSVPLLRRKYASGSFMNFELG